MADDQSQFLRLESIQVSPPSSSQRTSVARDMPGKISDILGSGKPAQEAIIWIVVRWSFYAAGGLTLIMVIISFIPHNPPFSFEITGIERIWSIFVPLI